MARRAQPPILGFVPLMILAAAAHLGAQVRGDTPTVRPVVMERGTARDSAATLRDARAAQARFERARRRSFPRKYGSSSPACDEVIGRFCHWEDGDTADVPLREPTPPEPAATITARERLIAELDSAGALLPGDAWISGMRVHYLLEAGQVDRAMEHVRACAADAWWCDALTGLVHHAAWRHAEADSAFARALEGMPESERCDWTNLEDLLADAWRAHYRRTPCSERAVLNTWVWWLADPLHLRHGNDRRTEHFARVVRSRLHRTAASGYGLRWGDDLDEIVRRYGWPAHYTQEIVPMGRMDPPRISSYHESPTYHFIADAGVPDDLRVVTDSNWTLRPPTARERYAPPYATFAALSHQASLFRREDSTLLVVAYDASADTLLASQPITAALIAAAGPDASHEHRSVTHGADPSGTLLIAVPDTPLIASAELVAGARVRRARFGVGFTDTIARALRISDLALFAPGDSLPDDLDTFLPLARASHEVAEGGKVGLFWELYGTPSAIADELTLDIEIVREGRSWLRRAGERVGLVGAPARVTFGWRASSPATTIAARAIVVDLTGLDRGWYRIEVSVTPDGGPPVVARRRIEIVR